MIDVSPAEEISSVNFSGGFTAAALPVGSPTSAHSSTAGQVGQSLDFILDVPLTITAVLGNSTMSVREVLQLAQGAVIPTSKFAGEPLEIFLNGRLISRGEVVVVNEKYGVRLTDVISPTEAHSNK